MNEGRRFSVVGPRRSTNEDNATEQARLLAFALCTADVLIEVDVDGRIIEEFGPTAALFGTRPKQLVDKTLESLALEDDRHLLRALLAQAATASGFEARLSDFVVPQIECRR